MAYKSMSSPDWQKANPGSTQQDYYSKYFYTVPEYTKRQGATAAETAAFDPNVSSMDLRNFDAKTALAGRQAAEFAADPAAQARRHARSAGAFAAGDPRATGASPSGVGAVAPGLPPPRLTPPPGAPPSGSRPGTAAALPGVVGPPTPGFAGVMPQRGAPDAAPGGGGFGAVRRTGLRTSFGMTGR